MLIQLNTWFNPMLNTSFINASFDITLNIGIYNGCCKSINQLNKRGDSPDGSWTGTTSYSIKTLSF